MAPLGIGALQLLNNSNLSPQDAMTAILQEISNLEATNTDLKENKQLLHKYILTIFLLYCRSLSIQHKKDKSKWNQTMFRFKVMLAEIVKSLTQITLMTGSNPNIKDALKKLKFLEMYFQINTTRIFFRKNKAFLRQIIGVYHVFDRLVKKLDQRITRKMNKIESEIAVLQQQYRNKAAVIKHEQDNSETSSIQDIKDNLKGLRMDVDGDSENELNSRNDNGISDEQVMKLQQLINESQQKNPSMHVIALEQLASLLPRNNLTAQLASKILIPQPPSIITAPAAVATTMVKPILVQQLPAIESNGLLAVTPAQISSPLIILGGAGTLAKKISGFKGGQSGQQNYYYVNNASNYQTYHNSNTYQTASTSSNYQDSGGYRGNYSMFGNGNGPQGNGGHYNPIAFHTEHMYDPYINTRDRNRNNQNNPNNPEFQNNRNENGGMMQQQQNMNQLQHPSQQQQHHNAPSMQHNVMLQQAPNMQQQQHQQQNLPPPPSLNNRLFSSFSSFRRKFGNNDQQISHPSNNVQVQNGAMNNVQACCEPPVRYNNMNNNNNNNNMNNNNMNNNHMNNNSNMNNNMNTCMFNGTQPQHRDRRPPPSMPPPPIPQHHHSQQRAPVMTQHVHNAVPFTINHNMNTHYSMNNVNSNAFSNNHDPVHHHPRAVAAPTTMNAQVNMRAMDMNYDVNYDMNENAYRSTMNVNNNNTETQLYLPVIAGPATNSVSDLGLPLFPPSRPSSSDPICFQSPFPTLAGQTESYPQFDDMPNISTDNKANIIGSCNGNPPNNNQNSSSGSLQNGYLSSCSLTSNEIKHSPTYQSSMGHQDNYSGIADLSSNSDSTVINLLPPSIKLSNCTKEDSSDSGIITPPSGASVPALTAVTPPKEFRSVPKLSGLSPIAPMTLDAAADNKVGPDEDPTSQHTSSGRLKKFQCNICNSYWFESTIALQMHVNTHIIMQRTTKKQSGDPNRPWQCEICKRKFAEKCTLKRHVRIHTNEKPWKCQYCSKAFNQSCSLQAHIRIHTGERPFPCTFCEKRFRQSTHRRQHMKRVHKQQWETIQLQNKYAKANKVKKKSSKKNKLKK